MNLALNEAEIALNNGDFPVGAVLVIDGRLISKRRNTLYCDTNWASHAELSIINENSKIIKQSVKNNNSKVVLYTTLEPCLMCLGAAVLHRVARIVFACPDPHGGATLLNPNNLTEWYIRKWPKIQGGLCREQAYILFIQFMKQKNTPSWNKILKLFEDMYNK